MMTISGFKQMITKFKEMFNGRVKTINPLIYASLLYVRDKLLMEV